MRTLFLALGVVLVLIFTSMYRGTLAERANPGPTDLGQAAAETARAVKEARDREERRARRAETLRQHLENLKPLGTTPRMPLPPLGPIGDSGQIAPELPEIPDEFNRELQELRTYLDVYLKSRIRRIQGIQGENIENDVKLEIEMPAVDEAELAEVVKAMRDEINQEVRFLEKKISKMRALEGVLRSAEIWHRTDRSKLAAQVAPVNLMAAAEATYQEISRRRPVRQMPQLEQGEYLKLFREALAKKTQE